MYNQELIKEIKEIHKKVKKDIEKATKGYKKAFLYSENDFFGEMCFCLLTPQSKAKNAWSAILKLKENGLLYKGNNEEISEYLNVVRFKNNKAKYIVELREKMTKNGVLQPKKILEEIIGFDNPIKTRNYIFETVKGMGLKEASHLLRNLGFGNDLAILDRHILRNLERLNVISEIPKTLTKKTYLEIEEKMKKFAKDENIEMEDLDLILWYKEAGEVFK